MMLFLSLKSRLNSSSCVSVKSEAEAGSSNDECVSVCVVPSELRAYGVWDVVGSGLMELRDSSSSLLFFTLSEAQTRLLHTELSVLHKQPAGEI